MSQIVMYGASDDLIEIEGDINEEFSFFPDNAEDVRFLAVSDGSIFRVQYDQDGIWRFTCLVAGTAKIEKTEGDVQADTPDYIRMDGLINWVSFGEYYAVRKSK